MSEGKYVWVALLPYKYTEGRKSETNPNEILVPSSVRDSRIAKKLFVKVERLWFARLLKVFKRCHWVVSV